MFVVRLINSGSNCYMNSTLQGISSCTNFITEINTLAEKHQSIDKLQLFKNLLEALTDGKKSEINARENQVFDHWRKRGQQDSFELFSYVINEVYKAIRKELKLEELKAWVQHDLPMRIRVSYELECSQHHRVTCPLQTSLALHVPIPIGRKDLDIQTLVNSYCLTSNIEDYICDECTEPNDDVQKEKIPKVDTDNEDNLAAYKKQPRKHSKTPDMPRKHTNLIGPLPNTICVHLQRTQWNGFRMVKIDKKIKINEDLQVNFKSSLESSEVDTMEIFKLRSVISHSGTPIFGHYVCYKKVNDKWFYTSDRSISPVNTRTVPDCQAYILFYEKTNK